MIRPYRVAAALEAFEGGKGREMLSVGAVGTFALGWLLPRLGGFRAEHGFVDLRLTTNNNRYWLTSLKSRKPTPAMAAFRSWILSPLPREPAASSDSDGCLVRTHFKTQRRNDATIPRSGSAQRVSG